MVVTAELTTSALRAARGERLVCEARVLKPGRAIVSPRPRSTLNRPGKPACTSPRASATMAVTAAVALLTPRDHAHDTRLPAARLARRDALLQRARASPTTRPRPSPRCSTPASASPREKFAPFNRLARHAGAARLQFDGERVHLPEATHAALAAYVESGMLSAAQDYDDRRHAAALRHRDGGECLLQHGQRLDGRLRAC